MSKQTYFEKLKDPRWQRKRLEIMERNNFACASCGADENTLNVHHKIYRKNTEPWDYEDDNFIVYCESCHTSLHEEKNFLMKNIDTVEKMRRLATLSYFCDAKHIEIAQIVCAFAVIEKHGELEKQIESETIMRANDMIERCQKLLKNISYDQE